MPRWCRRADLPPPRRLLAWLRLLLAADLLDDPGRSVASIAEACGYASEVSLKAALRQFMGAPPSELRRRGAFDTAARAFAQELFELREAARARGRPEHCSTDPYGKQTRSADRQPTKAVPAKQYRDRGSPASARCTARSASAGARRPTHSRSSAPPRRARARRAADLDRLRLALAAHDPQRTLERGYALVEDPAGAPVTSAAAARGHPRLQLRMADGGVVVRPEPVPSAAREAPP